MRYILPVIFLLNFCMLHAQHYDWPMWRFDYNRSASTPEQLADKLYLQWQADYSAREPVWDDPLNQNLMQFDRIFEPVIAGGLMFLGFNDQDKVVALDLNTGKEIWHFYTDGPVRLPMATNKGKLYLISDDGCCYCLDNNTGELKWKIILAPAGYKLLGNQRLISMWPARGGIVIKDDIIYTAASIFPLMGTFIYAINAESGEIVWENEGTGSNYILQPHRSPAFADVAPQGSFTISNNMLLVAGGRTVPAAFNLKTGDEEYYWLAESGKTGGAFTCSNEKVFFNHHRERMTYMYDTNTGKLIKANAGEYPVIDGDNFYFSGKNVKAAKLDEANTLVPLWNSSMSATNDLILAGDCLYGADSTGISAYKISGVKEPEFIWSVKTDRVVERLIAANGKLVAVTSDGSVLVYGNVPVTNVTNVTKVPERLDPVPKKYTDLIESTGIRDGYAVVYGLNDLELLRGLVMKTSLSVVAIGNDNDEVKRCREYFDRSGVTADRLSFLEYDACSSFMPKYFSSLTLICDDSPAGDLDIGKLRPIFESTRPYGGIIRVFTRNRKSARYLARESAGLLADGAVITAGKREVIISRPGPLKGSASWTHAYGDIANTIKSNDELVKAPLGVLWFGGNSNLDVLPRHGHGPSEQVIDGRLIIEGINSISARDVYTGRLIWKKEFENLKNDNWLVYYDETYDEENPLDPKYNQVHIPGANARGTNFIATKEFVYVLEGNKCHLLDISSGQITRTFTAGNESAIKLGYIGVYRDLLILGNNFADYPEIEIPLAEGEQPANKKFEDFDLTASRELIIMDRFTGEAKWKISANHGFIHNSVIVGDDILFCLDKLPQNLETKLRRRGESMPAGSRLLYLDVNTGKLLNEETKDIFGTWLGYSSEYKYLLQANRPSKDMLNGEDGKRMMIYDVSSKEVVWDREISYANPPIIHNDKIYTNGEGFSLLTGDRLKEKDLITGEDTDWGFKREYGCGYVVASENLLTFRSASAAFLNLNEFEGTASLGGFKAGCSANLIVADGVLNSPDYTRTCQCPYQNQTSLAFISMPWMSYWTNSNYKWTGKRIKNLGINLNAPGDRVSSDDILWLDFPVAGGPAPEIYIKMDTADYFSIRKDPLSVKSQATPWVSSSAVGGIRSMDIVLSGDENEGKEFYTVNLYFAELEDINPGDRVCDIEIQNVRVLDNFDIMKECGERNKEIVRSFRGIEAGNVLNLKMIPEKGNTILSGIEIKLESRTEN